MNSIVWGHHAYEDIRTGFIGKELSCKGKAGTQYAVMKELQGWEIVVGYLPRQIYHLRRGGVIARH